VLRQARADAAQDVRGCFHQAKSDVGSRDAAIAARDVTEQKIAQLGRQLHARVAASRDHEREHRPPGRGVRGVIGMLAQIENVIAQRHRVLKRLEVPRALARAGNSEKIAAAAQRDDERIVVERFRGQPHAPRGRLDGDHSVAPEAETAAPADVADGLDDVPRIDVARGNLREQRSKQQEILVVHQNNFRIPLEAPFQLNGHLQAAKAAAEQDNALGHEFTLAWRGVGRRPAETALAR